MELGQASRPILRTSASPCGLAVGNQLDGRRFDFAGGVVEVVVTLDPTAPLGAEAITFGRVVDETLDSGGDVESIDGANDGRRLG